MQHSLALFIKACILMWLCQLSLIGRVKYIYAIYKIHIWFNSFRSNSYVAF